MPFTVKFTFTGETHTEEQTKEIHDKLASMLYKFLGVTMDGDIPVAKFADQASANEYVEFMKQFDPATTDVQEVAH